MRDKKILLLFILFTIVATYRAPMVEAKGCLAGQCSGGQKQVCTGRSSIDRTCETVTCENIGNAGDCQNTGCTWTPQCCDFSNASSRTYRAGNGYCSASCGGGTCIYDAGSGNWQRTSCNTQSCTSPLPNCANLAGPSQITIGQSGTYTADHFSPQGSLRGTIDVGQNGQFLASSYPGVAPSGNSGSSSFTWTPPMVGTYDILCRSWNDAIAECRGKSNYVDGPPRYACSGPNSSMTVNVVEPRPALCQSATISKSTLSSGESLTITSTANTNQIKTFTYAFYNLNNLYGPNNPKPIYFTANTHYVVAQDVQNPTNTHTVTVNFSDLDKPDLNDNSQKPTNIQMNAYFTDTQDRFSAPDVACVVQFQLTTAPTPTTAPIPTPVGCYPHRQPIQCIREPCEAILVCPTPTPVPTCRPRPPCLDTLPRCLLPEPAEGWCPPTTPTPTCSPKPKCMTEGEVVDGRRVYCAFDLLLPGGWFCPDSTPTSIPTPGPTEATCDNSTGDANCNTKVDLADFELWRKEFTGEAKTKKANFSRSGKTSLADFEIWRVNFFKKGLILL